MKVFSLTANAMKVVSLTANSNDLQAKLQALFHQTPNAQIQHVLQSSAATANAVDVTVTILYTEIVPARRTLGART